MPHIVAVLDADRERVAAMKAALDAALPARHVAWFDEAPHMIDWLSGNLSRICLFSLDHDLGPKRQRGDKRFDPGFGRDVVDFLVTRAPSCPVIIHSSNSIAADVMMTALEGAGWSAERVVPGDDLAWVSDPWSARVKFHVDRIMGPGMQVPDAEYRKLESLLSQERWKDADDATGSILRALTGQEQHLIPEAVPLIRCEDLQRICALWDQHSNGRYGFSIQARIWAEVGGMARLVPFNDMNRDEREALGLIERRFLKRVGKWWGSGPGPSDPTQPGHFPIGVLQCSYGFGLIGMLVAAFAWRLLDCGLLGPDVAFSDRAVNP